MDSSSIARLAGHLRASSRREWRGMALACAILVVHLAGAAHRAFERHVLCADHGRWTHEEACAPGEAPRPELVGDTACGTPHATAKASLRCESESLVDAEASAQVDASRGWPSDEHHHCLLVTMARVDGTPPLEPRLPADSTCECRASLVRPADEVHAAVSILDLAPKQSPPAA